jgi:putative colanic acid biosynthesis UDP-glucose lipid carrier transferase
LHRFADSAIVCASLAISIWVLQAAWSISYGSAAAIGIAVFFVLGSFLGLYGSWRSDSAGRELGQVARCWVGVILVTVALVYATGGESAEVRNVIALWWILGLSATFLFRVVIRTTLRYARSLGRNNRVAVIVGAGPVGVSIALRIKANPWMGIRVKGFYDDRVPVGSMPADGLGARVLGRVSAVVEDLAEQRPDQVYIALPMRAEKKSTALVNALRDTAIEVHFIPDVFVFNLLNARLRDVGGIPTISVYESPLAGPGRFFKRMEDVCLSVAILLVFLLPMLCIAVAVKLTSRGPVVFKQKRFGLNGEEITVWKFRTMLVCDEGSHLARQATRGDDRVTALGRFLRRTSLDELPQFLNVLYGSMSVVGPRPHPVALNEQYRALIRGYMLRHLVKPGITGLAQVNGWRGETDTIEKMEKRVQCDIEYISNWSVWLDLKIVAITVFRGFVHKNAY